MSARVYLYASIIETVCIAIMFPNYKKEFACEFMGVRILDVT